MYITPTKKKYLTVIKKLQATGKEVKAVMIARYLGVSKPSVSTMLRQLEKDGLLILHDGCRTHMLHLSISGEKTVQQIEKHCHVLETMLRSFGAPATAAEKDAIALEPYLSDETYAALHIQ
jgi:Mn-dependent DtxR family transcriptional regulator